MRYEDDLRCVNEWSFLADDLRLYLDTHPGDAHAFAALKNALYERRAAVDAFEKAHGALTADAMAGAQTYDWVERPFPVE